MANIEQVAIVRHCDALEKLYCKISGETSRENVEFLRVSAARLSNLGQFFAALANNIEPQRKGKK